MGKITRTEWRWVAGFVAFFLVFTTIPYWVAETRQTDIWRFGGVLFAADDSNSYIAKMVAGAAGAWTYRLVYSSEPQSGALAFLFYLLLGKLAGVQPTAEALHTRLVLLYQLARWVGNGFWLSTVYVVLAQFLRLPRQRRLGLVFVALGGGLGWLLVFTGQSALLGERPLDFISPEAFSFLALWGLPHLPFAYALMFWGWLAYWRQRAVWAGLAFLGMTVIQPIYGPPVWLLLALDVVVDFARRHWHFAPQRRVEPPGPPRWQQALIAGLISSPVVLYSLVAFNTDPVLRQWTAQSNTRSPHFLHYLFAYGVWLLPAGWGWRLAQRRLPALARFSAVWLAVLPWLLYLPFPSIQRRMAVGAHVPLTAFTVLGLTVAGRRWRRWAVPSMVVVTSLTALVLWVGSIMVVLKPAEPLFHLNDQIQAFNQLGTLAQPGDVVLSAYRTGNVLPAYVPVVAYIGHGAETVFLAEKEPLVAAFYTAATPTSARLQLLAAGGIRWVIFGPDERTLGDFDPSTADYLRLAFTDGRYAVYEVAP